MKMNREEKKAHLEARAGQAIDEYPEWEERHPKPDLMEMEDIILKLWKELGREMTQILLAERLLPVRSAIVSKRFDAHWKIAYNSPPN